MRKKSYRHLQIVRAFLVLVLSMLFFRASAQHDAPGRKNGMLILGSADMKTLVERVEIGYRLYASAVPFDYIIVSGGCAAHQSAICEASEMINLLVQKGVPAEIIFKEEKSKNTVQNYAYSRVLRKADGTKVISPGDKLYVVSNHWHAIPVAARFTENDGVTALYHIEGGILPKNTDKVNYTNIFDPNIGSDDFSVKALWPLIGASFSVESKKKGQNTSYYFISDLVSVKESTKSGEGEVAPVTQALPAIPANWAGAVDATYHNSIDNKVYIFRGEQYARFSPDAKTLDAGYPKLLTDLVKDLPAHWQGGFLDAAFFHPRTREVYLFKGEEYLRLSARNSKVVTGFPRKTNTIVPDWPLAWGSGNLDAADYKSNGNKIYLFRGKEYVVISGNRELELEPGYPRNMEQAWPEDILGKK